MNGARDAEVLHDFLPRNIGSTSSQFLRQRRLDQGHPASHPLYLVSRSEHSAVGALDQFASSFASLASSPRASFLWHYSAVLQSEASHEYIISSCQAISCRTIRS
jgi:hypothetical protein